MREWMMKSLMKPIQFLTFWFLYGIFYLILMIKTILRKPNYYDARHPDLGTRLESMEAKIDVTNSIFEKLVQEIKEFSTSIRVDVRILSTNFKEFHNNIVKSDEREVVQAVFEYLLRSDQEIHGGPEYNFTIRDYDHSVKGKADGFIFMTERTAALVEVKQALTEKDVEQIRTIADLCSRYMDLDHVMMFIGGPIIDRSVATYVLKFGIYVVEPSGERYRILVPRK